MCCIVICGFMQNTTTQWRRDDKRRTKTSLKNIPLTLFERLHVRGSWRPNRTAIYWPPLLWLSALCLSCSPWLLNRRPGGSAFCWVIAFSTASCLRLLWSPTQSGVPKAPSAGWWLSLLHLVSNSSDLQLTDFLSPPSYIIVKSPTQYLWNGVFVRHQAEITVMQFTGHSLPVHQSMSVPWDFNPVPHCQPSSPIPMEYALPRLWNGISVGVEGQYTTDVLLWTL